MNARAADAERIALESLGMPSERRAAFVAQACLDDTALRLLVLEWLRVHAEAEVFLETPCSRPASSTCLRPTSCPASG